MDDIGDRLREKGFTNEDLLRLKKEAEDLMRELEKKFASHGIERKWKLSDMIVDIDLESKIIRSMTPTDWERTKIQ
ncbi:MAG TPA: hypothetical protein VFQ60_01720 [Patescibacteria group bacterium]|nr:hypothetical protein [Patescibacteria group bacterium]